MYGLVQVSSHVSQAQIFATFLGFPSSTGAILSLLVAVASDYIPSGVRPAEKWVSFAGDFHTKHGIHSLNQLWTIISINEQL